MVGWEKELFLLSCGHESMELMAAFPSLSCSLNYFGGTSVAHHTGILGAGFNRGQHCQWFSVAGEAYLEHAFPDPRNPFSSGLFLEEHISNWQHAHFPASPILLGFSPL